MNVWEETGLTVLPNTDYLFSAWLASVYPANPAQLVFSVNGVRIGSPFGASSTPGVWEQFSTVLNSAAGTSMRLDIVNLNTESGGNDFALDDIDLTPRPIPEPVSLLLLGPALAGLGLIKRRERDRPSLNVDRARRPPASTAPATLFTMLAPVARGFQ